MDLNFIEVFNQKISEKNIDWEVSALAASNDNLYSLGIDFEGYS